jgi:Na+-translocating ferredoxin:NAD+ oxidoreductase subunit C
VTLDGRGDGRSFRHGIHPPEHKRPTAAKAIERMPFVDEYVLPLSQHIGAPSAPIVEVGQRVKRGERIADPGGFVSVALHAPVTGHIEAIELRLHPNGRMMQSIVVHRDPWSSQALEGLKGVDLAKLSTAEAIKMIQMGGIVGLGGAAFPSHVKLSVPEGKVVEEVVINGCECESYLTCDHRLMTESADAVVRGTQILMKLLGGVRGWIGIEQNKPDAIEALRAVAPDDIEVVGVQVKYPQGAEKMLVEALFGVEIPKGGLPLDRGILTNNVGTTAALADLFDRGIPLVERLVTVTGPGVDRPRNLMVPLGTPLRALLEHCGLRSETVQVIAGGPMMGAPQKSIDTPVLKGTSGILCLDSPATVNLTEFPCIRCGRCLRACPMFLNPARLARLVRAGRAEEAGSIHLMNCFECASCSYVCPSGIPLVQWMRVGKTELRNLQRKAAE